KSPTGRSIRRRQRPEVMRRKKPMSRRFGSAALLGAWLAATGCGGHPKVTDDEFVTALPGDEIGINFPGDVMAIISGDEVDPPGASPPPGAGAPGARLRDEAIPAARRANEHIRAVLAAVGFLARNSTHTVSGNTASFGPYTPPNGTYMYRLTVTRNAPLYFSYVIEVHDVTST